MTVTNTQKRFENDEELTRFLTERQTKWELFIEIFFPFLRKKKK